MKICPKCGLSMRFLVMTIVLMALFVAQASADFMVPLETTKHYWGGPKRVTNDGHRYVFENRFRDTAVVYTNRDGDVFIDALMFSPGRERTSYELKEILEPRIKLYKWEKVYGEKRIGDRVIKEIDDAIVFVSSHGKYIAIAYKGNSFSYNSLIVLRIELYELFMKGSFNPFYSYKKDIVNNYLYGKQQLGQHNGNFENTQGIGNESGTNTSKEESISQDVVTPAKLELSCLSFEPLIEMEGNIFPSYIIAMATVEGADKIKTSGNYRGDRNGVLGIKMRNNTSEKKVKIEIESTTYIKNSFWEGTIEPSNEIYTIFPVIEYNFPLFYKTKQPVLDTVTFKVYVNNSLEYEEKKRVTVRPINECPFYLKDRSGNEINTSFLFAAYVNEDHPIIDQFLSEAKTFGLEKTFVGYQGDIQKVINQVFTVWYGLQRKGITYSSITETSLDSSKIFSQNVRFVDEAINNSQANCVDGSVLIASILRRIGIDPFLIFVPGHCYLGFYASPGKKNPCFLETTMIGNVDLKKTNTWLNLQSRRQVAAQNFNQALAVGQKNFNIAVPHIQNSERGYILIDIKDIREKGLMVLKSREVYTNLRN